MRITAISLMAGLLAIVGSTLAAAAAADKDPSVEACVGKAENAPCATKRPVKREGQDLSFVNEPGTCQTQECCELDYSQGSPPKSVCSQCLACKAGGPSVGSGGGESGGDDGKAVEQPHSDDSGPPAPSPGKKGCAIGEPGSGLAIVVLALVRRRRGLSRSTASRGP